MLMKMDLKIINFFLTFYECLQAIPVQLEKIQSYVYVYKYHKLMDCFRHASYF